jgi:hypothetical protein
LFWRSGETEPSDAKADTKARIEEICARDIPLATARAAELGCAVSLPRGFDRWFARSVAPSPEARWRSVDAQLRALRKAFGGEGREDDETTGGADSPNPR